MIIDRFPELARLSSDEMKQLALEILDESFDAEKPDPAIIAILEQRRRQFDADPSTARNWAEVRDRILGSQSAGRASA